MLRFNLHRYAYAMNLRFYVVSVGCRLCINVQFARLPFVCVGVVSFFTRVSVCVCVLLCVCSLQFTRMPRRISFLVHELS
jgi:hypothetical protein